MSTVSKLKFVPSPAIRLGTILPVAVLCWMLLGVFGPTSAQAIVHQDAELKRVDRIADQIVHQTVSEAISETVLRYDRYDQYGGYSRHGRYDSWGSRRHSRWEKRFGYDDSDYPDSRRARWRGYRDPRSEYFPAMAPAWVPKTANWFRIDRDSAFGVGFGANLNRVDGLSFLASQTLANKGWVPTFRFYQGYGFSSDEWSGAADFSMRPDDTFILGARWASETTAFHLPRQPITFMENFVTAFFTRDDFFDYMRQEGWSYYTEVSPKDGQGIRVSYHEMSHKSRRRRIARFGLFGGDKEFRPNPEVEDGDWKLIQARIHWRGSSRRSIWGSSGGNGLLVDSQWSGGKLGGERWFTRLWGEYKGEIRLSPRQALSFRVGGGATPQGLVADDGSKLPRQWQFEAGGVGSLRGHKFQEFRGDRIALGTLEYGVDLDDVRPVLFVDGGKAWNESDDASGGIGGSGPLEVDGGIGFLFGWDGVRIDFARDLRKQKAPLRTTVRLSHSY